MLNLLFLLTFLITIFSILPPGVCIPLDKSPLVVDGTNEQGLLVPGATYTIKTTSNKENHTRTYRVIDDDMFENKIVHRISEVNENRIIIIDKVTKNYICTIKNGRKTDWAKPHIGVLNFPLFVAKKYTSEYDFNGGNWSGHVKSDITIQSYEKVKVPAGIFEAFKIRVENEWVKIIYWYSPHLKLFVKVVIDDPVQGHILKELVEYKFP